jgi:hypothetical protein
LLTELSFHRLQGKPQAIVHIGPHKTSSTRIQAFVARFVKELEDANIYWMQEKLNPEPNSDNMIKHLSLFAYALRRHTDPFGTIPKMKAFFENSLANNRSIIISSEELDQCLLEEVKLLRDMLTGFDVKIVFVYREFLSHMVSLQFEFGRLEHHSNFSTPFSSHLFKNMDRVPSILDPAQVLQPYEAVFGRDSVVIVDLYGVNAAKKDIAHVVVCEIAGALCNNTEALQADMSGMNNPSYSLIHSQVFSHYYAYVSKFNHGKCRFCKPSLFAAYKDFNARLIRDIRSKSAPAVPVVQSHLGMLLPLAERIDAQLRADYGHQVLYSDPAANLRVMREDVHVECLDAEAFMMSQPWHEYMQRTFRAAVRAKGRMCNCNSGWLRSGTP